MATRPPKRAADGCWQVFGLANLAAGGRMPTVRRFPGRLAQCILAEVVFAYRCGAVPEFHRVPFLRSGLKEGRTPTLAFV